MIGGDRLNSGFCLKCGSVLILPWNDYQLCSECTKFVRKALYEFEKKRRKVKKMGAIKVRNNQIGKQISPIGAPVQ